MKTTIWTAAAIVILVSAVTAWLGFDLANATRAALADGSTKRAALAKEISHARERNTDADRTMADLRAALKMAQAEAEKQAAAASSTKPTTVRPPRFEAVLEAHPALRGLYRQNFRASLRLDDQINDHYPLFYKSAGLTPEQIQKFEDLMLDHDEQGLDLEATLIAQRPGRAVIDKMRQQLDEKLQAAQMELLGPAGYQRLQEFNRAKPQNQFASDVVTQVALTSAPFTAAQTQQLLNVLTTSVRANAVVPANPRDNGYQVLSKTTDWPRVLTQAEAFLSPTQLSVLKGNVGQVDLYRLVREFYLREGIPAGK